MHIHTFGLLLATCLATTVAESPFSGKLNFYTSGWDEWDKHTSRWSAFGRPTFSMVFKPETAEELSQGIAALSSNKIPYLATKAGGHGNVPTLGHYKDVVQVNLDNFRYANVNKDKTITVGGGARMIDFIPALHKAGREMTVGSFPCVGVHGVLLGGGMGRMMGLYGLSSDAALKMKVALWNGTVVEASEKENSDLFWGLRGAGHNLGVVIETTFKTWPDKGGIHYNADMVFTDDSIDGVLTVCKEIIEAGLDPAVFLIIGFIYDADAKKPLLILNIVWAHDSKLGAKLSEKFASTGPDASLPITRLSLKETDMDFAELASGRALPGVCDVNLRNTLYTASTPTLFDVSAMKDVYHSFGAFVADHPVANRSILLFEAAAPGVIRSKPDDYTAYPHRGRMTTNAIIQMTWDDESEEVADAANAWGRKTRATLANPKVSGYDRPYAYVNYANIDDPLQALYGYDRWRHERLTGLKQKYDPHGVFNAYRPLPTDMSGWDAPAESRTYWEKDEL